jgi:hypothetical protein
MTGRHDVLEARQLLTRDAAGRKRIELSPSGASYYDDRGRLRASISANDSLTSLKLLDPDPDRVISLSIVRKGPTLIALGKDGDRLAMLTESELVLHHDEARRIILSLKDAYPTLAFENKQGKTRFRVSDDDDGTSANEVPWMRFCDGQETDRILLGGGVPGGPQDLAGPTRLPCIRVKGEDGKDLWKAP